jgi:glycerol-3-phosphate dehydrogenase
MRGRSHRIFACEHFLRSLTISHITWPIGFFEEQGLFTNDPVADLLVVGGGINGTGIARDAAGRGLKVVLVEQRDLASATSSASTKLIHGGLRYLEHYEFQLVREALMERERLLAIAPHIIWPLEFVLPHVQGLRPRWLMRIGLMFYDHAGGRRRLPASRGVSLAGQGLGEALRPDIRHGFSYSDCWVDDSRLVILNAMDAAARGAAIHPHTQLVSATADSGLWRVQCRDNAAQRHVTFAARAVVNAAGPWVDDVINCFSRQNGSKPKVRLIKGSHIVVPRLYAGEHAYTLQHPDGRVVFTIPYEGAYTVIGTTDVPFEGDAATAGISAEECGYLCDTVNRYFAGPPIGPADVKWSYAGVRPLFDDDSEDASRVTRDYTLDFSGPPAEAPLLSVFGGKITTYRKLAEAALAKLQPHVGGARQSWTDRAPLPGGDLPRHDPAAFLRESGRRWPFLPENSLLRMTRAYGTRLERIMGNACRLSDLGKQYGAGLSEAEVAYLAAEEWAVDADDFLWRRSKLGLHMSAAERERFADRTGAHRQAYG